MQTEKSVSDMIREATVHRGTNHIRQRQLDASRRELFSMTSEIEHYGSSFTRPQLLAMRKTMRALKELIATLET